MKPLLDGGQDLLYYGVFISFLERSRRNSKPTCPKFYVLFMRLGNVIKLIMQGIYLGKWVAI